MLKELMTSVRGALYDRAMSPLAGTLVLVWLIFNWEPVAIVLFSSGDIIDRIVLVRELYADDARTIWWPALTTVAVLIAYPLLAAGAFYWSERLDSWQRKTRRRFGLDVPLSPAESLELRERLNDAEKRLADVITARERRVAELEASNQKLLDENTALKPKVTPEAASQAKILAEQLEALRQENAVLRAQMLPRSPADPETIAPLGVQESLWKSELDALNPQEQMRFTSAMRAVLDRMVSGQAVGTDHLRYAVGKGLADYDSKIGLSLTAKGKFLAQFVV